MAVPADLIKPCGRAKEISDGVELTRVSPDGDQGFPGTVTATVRYTLTAQALKIEYVGRTDRDADINLTNHTYVNLAPNELPSARVNR